MAKVGGSVANLPARVNTRASEAGAGRWFGPPAAKAAITCDKRRAVKGEGQHRLDGAVRSAHMAGLSKTQGP
jgi:hypothetical protein